MKDQYFIVRTDHAGVFFGKIDKKSADSVTMTNVRKIFYWDGACAVEELAMNGTKKPNNCKITVEIPMMEIADPIQIIPCTDAAVKSLTAQTSWS